MSSDRQRLVGAIRRIANISPEDGEGATESSNRGSQPGAVGQGITESNDRLCCDGSVSGNPNPGTATRDSSDGTGGLDGSDPADISGMGGGCLSGVTDCDTAAPVCFCGEGFIPPDGWEDPKTGPVDPTYQDGVLYEGPSIGRTHSEAIEGTGYSLGGESISPPKTYEYCQGTGPRDCETESYNVICGGGCFSGGSLGNFTELACGTVPDPDDLCDKTADDYRAEEWPTDSCVNLAILGGKIVGSKYDPENDGSYNAPRDEIELCDAAGNSILLRGSGQFGGGYKTIKSLSGDIDPDTDHGYLWSAYGDMIQQISPSEFRDDRV